MPSRPRTVPPNFRFQFWIEHRGQRHADRSYTCNRCDLERALAVSGVPEHVVRQRMGHGFKYLATAFAGEVLDRWQVAHIEGGLAPLTEREIQDYGALPPPEK